MIRRPTIQSLVAMDATRDQIQDWARMWARAVPAGERYLLCRVLGKHVMYVLQNDSAITPHLAMDGIWEPWVTMAIARHLRPGMRCMDVGACYGYYALLMADIVGSGLVAAWEPVHHELLGVNVGLSGLGIQVVAAAMGSQHGARAVFDRLPTGSRLFNAGGVTMRPADSALTQGGMPYTVVAQLSPTPGPYDFIKIDVEGAEADVWRALDGVKACSPKLTVCMEFTPKQHLDPLAFLETIMRDGFTLGSVGHDGMPRSCSIDEALVPDTGDFRMLWLTKEA